MEKIEFTPIGIIHTPYRLRQEVPKGGKENPQTEGYILLDEKYLEGIADMHIDEEYWLLFYFHQSKGYELTVHARGDGPLRGLFSTHSPNRPNGIGLSLVTIKAIEGCRITFTGVDMLDGTPLLDIKDNGPKCFRKNET